MGAQVLRQCLPSSRVSQSPEKQHRTQSESASHPSRSGVVAMKPTRTRLPDRRGCETFDVWHGEGKGRRRFHVSIGRFRTGELAEVFITGPKSGSDLEAVCR